MPNSDPTKVRISPNATSTELSMTPVGGTQNPATNRHAPSAISTTAQINWILLSICFIISWLFQMDIVNLQ